MKKTIIIVMGLILVVLFSVLLFPKDIYFEFPNKIRECGCIGFKAKEQCFGIPGSCKVKYKEPPSMFVGGRPKGSIDLTLVIDKSESMKGNKLRLAKESAYLLIDQLYEDDRMALIPFDNTSRVKQDFSSDKDKLKEVIEEIDSGSTSEYIPALDMIHYNYMTGTTSSHFVWKVIFISDGEPTDKAGLPAIYHKIHEITSDNICIYTVGFGDKESLSTKAEDILKNISLISYRNTHCGGYFRAKDNASELVEALFSIYDDILTEKLEININSPKNQRYYSKDIKVDFNTNIPAVCHYQLNSGNRIRVYSNNFDVETDQKENVLKIECEKNYGYSDSVSEIVEFTVDPSSFSLLSSLGRKLGRKKEITRLEGDDIMELLQSIVDREDLTIIKKVNNAGTTTVVYFIIQNNKPVTLKNVKIQQKLPLNIADSDEEFSVNEAYDLINIRPPNLQFSYDKLEPEETVTIVYTFPKQVYAEYVNLIETKILYDEITNKQIADMVKSINETQNAFEMTRESEYKDGKTKGRINLNPLRKMEKVKVYLDIPKCMAYHIDKIYFKNLNYKVIASDPMILWDYETVDEEISLEYELDKKLEEMCENQLAVIPVADELGESLEEDKKDYTLVFLVLLPLIIVILYFYQDHLEDNLKLPRWMTNAFIIVLVFALLILLFFPRTMKDEMMNCACFGFSDADKCFGIPYNCQHFEEKVNTEENVYQESCTTKSCEVLSQYLRIQPKTYSKSSVDLVLILDHSKSMEKGDKLQSAKMASKNLIPLLGKDDKMALIEFDNSSKLVQSFTRNESQLKESIDSINLGFTTKYIPPLNTAHWTFMLESDRFKNWQLIFISDGSPWDEGKPDKIYDKVREMVSDDICINTIGFGEEITPGSEAEVILKRMAKISRDTIGCGSYYYAPKNMKQLSDILGQVYLESSTKKLQMNIDATINAFEFTTAETMSVTARLSSSLNNQPIPGEFTLDENTYCSPAAKIRMLLKKKGHEEVFEEYPLIYDGHEYSINKDSLPVGEFSVYLEANLTLPQKNECPLSGRLYLGDIIVVPFKGFKKCMTDSCYEVHNYLNTLATEPIIEVTITDYAFIPMNITISDGTIVRWVNKGEKPHTVTSGEKKYDGQFTSPILQPGDSYNITFEKGGVFKYFDNLSVELAGKLDYDREKNITLRGFTLKYNGSLDLTLLIDKSGSMYKGSQIDQVRNATKNLIRMLYPGDKVSVITFSDKAVIDTLFAAEKSVALTKVQEIASQGETKYIPALETVEKYYQKRSQQKKGKIVILLSDGIPWDEGKPDSIFNEVEDLVEQGVCVYTIGYGDEVYPGSEAEKILKGIVDISQASENCGRYYYTPSDETKLIKIFGAIYYENKNAVDGLILYPTLSQDVMIENETAKVTTKVKSAYNSKFLPGYINIPGLELCGPPAVVLANLKDKNNKTVKSIEMEYVGDSTGYSANISNMRPGSYNVEVSARSACTDKKLCDYKGSSILSLTVLDDGKADWSLVSIAAGLVIIITIGSYFVRKYTKKTEQDI
jgi:Mg-chelatase subunit ChlD/plastocyanin